MRNNPEFLSTLRETNTLCPRCLLARQTALSEGRCLIRTGRGGGVGTTHMRLSHECFVHRRPTLKPGLLSALCDLNPDLIVICVQVDGSDCVMFISRPSINPTNPYTLTKKKEKNSNHRFSQSKLPRKRPCHRSRETAPFVLSSLWALLRQAQVAMEDAGCRRREDHAAVAAPE